MLVWHNNGPSKRTILYRDPVPHSLPKPHVDLLEQFVDYRVPPDRFDELAAYDGSVIAERTKGELSARCDKEEMNFLTLNLVHEILTGKRTVEQARQVFAEVASAFTLGRPAPYAEGFLFQPPAHQMLEKAKDLLGGEPGSAPPRTLAPLRSRPAPPGTPRS